MPIGPRITVRLTPPLAALVKGRVRQGESLSDIVREALDAYLGACPTPRLTPAHASSDSAGKAEAPRSDTLSDIVARMAAMASDVSDIQARLARLESPPETRPAQGYPRQTPRQAPRQTTCPTQPTFDPTRHRLGKLCPRGHDWQGTGQSLRVNNKAGYCLACNAEDARARRQTKR